MIEEWFEKIMRWLAMCEAGTPPIDELISDGFAVAALAIICGNSGSLPNVNLVRRARAACFGPERVRTTGDIPAGLLISNMLGPTNLGAWTAADDPIRLGYACAGWIGDDLTIRRLRAGADPAVAQALAAWGMFPNLDNDKHPDAGDALGWAAYCIKYIWNRSRDPAAVFRAAADGDLEPELALILFLTYAKPRSWVVDGIDMQLAARPHGWVAGGSDLQLAADLLAQAIDNKRTDRLALVLPPIIV